MNITISSSSDSGSSSGNVSGSSTVVVFHGP